MKSIELKRKVLDVAIKKHQSVIDDFRFRLNTVLREKPTEEDEMDMDQQSKTSEKVLTELNPLSDQLEFANEEMRLLLDMRRHQEEMHDSVQLGSIVVTDKDTFFVSASIERFEVEGKKMFGLSTQAPLYQVMKGKKKGDTFTYKKKTYTIKDIV